MTTDKSKVGVIEVIREFPEVTEGMLAAFERGGNYYDAPGVVTLLHDLGLIKFPFQKSDPTVELTDKGRQVLGWLRVLDNSADTAPAAPAEQDPPEYGVSEIVEKFPEFTAEYLRPFARPAGWGYAIPEPINQQTALAVEVGLICRLKPDLLNPDQDEFGRYRLTSKGRGVLVALNNKGLEDKSPPSGSGVVTLNEPGAAGTVEAITTPKPVAATHADLVAAVRRMCQRNGGVNESSLYQFVIEVMGEQKPKTSPDPAPMLELLRMIRDNNTGEFEPWEIARDALDFWHDVMEDSK